MRSLYIAILAVTLGVLALSYFVFRSISTQIEKTYFDPVFERIDLLEIESARSALEAGGTAALAEYLGKLNRIFGGSHFLVDDRGTDIISGTDLRNFVPHPPALKSRSEVGSHIVVTQRAADGRFWLVAVAPIDRSGPPRFVNYYVLIASVVILLFWLAAVGLVNPIRKVSTTADRFGQGALNLRIHLGRKDEIGSLANSFNDMADRIETLIKSERRLMQDISHELRSPLARLKLAVRLARTSQNRDTALDRIETDVDRMTVLIGDLLDISRVERDPSSVAEAEFDIDALVRATVMDCKIEADTRGCPIVVTGAIESQVIGSREWMRRAIENVIRNAIRFSPDGEAIVVHMAERIDVAVITVRDRGPGVEQQFVASIFDPFFRTDPAREASGGGVGLGLAIAKRAVQLHGGVIQARNTDPGLEVLITVPVSRDSRP